MAQQFWVPHPTEVWGVAVEAPGGSYKLWRAFDSSTDPNNLTFTPSAQQKSEIRPIVDPKGLQGLDNICDLSDVSEASLLQTLRQRYKERQIYTNVGRIVLSLNPFEYLPLYGEDSISQYMHHPDPYCLQPHVYQVSAAALQNLRDGGKPQAALITGESGAGKTETTKFILQFLATAGSGDTDSGKPPVNDSVQQRVLEANPILEAFGNASTSRNPNSSRFGKWIEVIFSERYKVVGARVTSYLLELPRVVGHAEGERNYHVFYQIFEGLKDSLKGLQGQYQLVNDADGLGELKHALQTLGFRATQQNDLFSIVAAVLHLGNIKFASHSGGGGDGSAPDPSTKSHVASAAGLLGVSEEGLLEALVSRSLKTGNEVIKMVLAPEKARAAADGFAQLAYSCLFSWLIKKVNESLQPPQTSQVEGNIVGILDIAGFESFKTNGFEQLCINLSNEKLQHHFNRDIFLNEIADYQKDGLQDLKLTYHDNADVLDLIEGKGGIFAVLDEELFVPKGSEQGFVTKLAKSRASDKRLIPSKASGALSFSIDHYAGVVAYNATGWLQKNQNAPPAEAVKLLGSSSNEIMVQATVLLNEKAASQTAGKGKSKSTVASEFKRQLKDLMDRIEKTTTHYVRCVKPNKQHVPMKVCSEDILSQLTCSGVMEAVRIRKAGFALRLPHADFVARYGIMMGKQAKSLKGMQQKEAAGALVVYIRGVLGFKQDACLVGTSKVFCRDTVQEALESNRRICLASPAILIQKYVRGFLVRRRVAVVLELSRQLRVFVTAMDRAKAQRGSFLSPTPVFSDATDARTLKQKAADLHAIITKCEELGPGLEPPVLSPAKRVLAKMSNEAAITMKLDTLLEALPEDTEPLEELLTQAQTKGVSNATTDRAAAVANQIKAEQELMASLTSALEARDLATVKEIVAKAQEVTGTGKFITNGLASLVDVARKFLASPPPKSPTGAPETAELEASISQAQQQQRLKSKRTLQNEILRQTLRSRSGADALKLLSAVTSIISKESVMPAGTAAKPVRVRPRSQSLESSGWSDSDSDDDEGYYEFFEAQNDGAFHAEANGEGQSQSQYLQKFLEELSRATAQCDAETLQFLLSRAAEAGIPPGQREVRVAQQQLSNLNDPHWLECELKECVILLSWGSVSQADVARLSSLIKQARATPGIKREILFSAESTQKAISDPDFGKSPIDDAAGLYSLENCPDLAINIEIKKAKSTARLERLVAHRDALVSFQREALTEPLLPLPDPLDKEALAIFRKIQCLMGDRFSVGYRGVYTVELVKTATACDALRDEMYVQLLKQLRGNTNSTSVLKGYTFLAELCECCPPSPSFDRYVRRALELHLSNTGAEGLFTALDEEAKHHGVQSHAVQGSPTVHQSNQAELKNICAEALRALEANSITRPNADDHLRKERKSVIDYQIFLTDGSRRRVPLSVQATAGTLCSGTAASLNMHNADEWAIEELLPPYLLKPCRSGLDVAPCYRLLQHDEPVLRLIENANRQVTLVFRRPFLRLRENVAPHPMHSRLTCHQAVADHLNYPLEEPPEILAEIAAKIVWYKASSRSTSGGGSKWLVVADGLPVRSKAMLPPHRWVALYEQHAQELDADESEFVKMNGLFTSLKKLQVFGGSFFLCDPFELKLKHLLSHAETLAKISAKVIGAAPDDAVVDNESTQNTIEALIDNSLYKTLIGAHQGAASRLPRLRCLCPHRTQGTGRVGLRNETGMHSATPQRKAFAIKGRCWFGFGEARLVLQAEEAEECDGGTMAPKSECLAAAFNGKSLSILPEELIAAYALDSSGTVSDLLILVVQRACHAPRMCALITQVQARCVLQFLQTLYPHIAAAV